MVAVGAAAPDGAAAPTAGVSVVINGSPRQVDLTEIPYDVPPTVYTSCCLLMPEPVPTHPTHQGVSLAALIQAAGGAAETASQVRVQRRDGSWVDLDPNDVSGVSFPEGPAVFWTDGLGASNNFFRPMRDPDDLSDRNVVDEVRDEPVITVVVHQGPLIDVTASADRTHVDVGSPVTFRAVVTGGETGESFDLTWDLGDGRVGSGSRVRHAYTRAGTFRPVVTALGSFGSGGSSGRALRIVVGRSPGEPGPGLGGSDHGGSGHDRGPPGGEGAGGSGSGSGSGPGSGIGSGEVSGTGRSSPSPGRGALGGQAPPAEPVRGFLVASMTAAGGGSAAGGAGGAGGAFGAGGTGDDPGSRVGDGLAVAAALALFATGGLAERSERKRRRIVRMG